MFFCQKCAEKNSWPFFYGLPMSFGACEICETRSECVDIPSSALPVPKKDPSR